MTPTSGMHSSVLISTDKCPGDHQFQVAAINKQKGKMAKHAKMCYSQCCQMSSLLICEIHCFYSGFSLKLFSVNNYQFSVPSSFFSICQVCTFSGWYSQRFQHFCFLSVIKIHILTQVKTVFSLRYYSLAFPDHMKGSLICGYILQKNSSVESRKAVAFRITCIQIYIHILKTDKFELHSYKKKK